MGIRLEENGCGWIMGSEWGRRLERMTVSGAGGEEQVEPGVKGYESSSRAWKGMQ